MSETRETTKVFDWTAYAQSVKAMLNADEWHCFQLFIAGGYCQEHGHNLRLLYESFPRQAIELFRFQMKEAGYPFGDGR